MGMGIGKQYWVEAIKIEFGDLNYCIEFMKNNPPKDKYEWYELVPIPTIKKGEKVNCNYYRVSLVRDGK